MSDIRAIYYDKSSVGKRIKSSKKRYFWRMMINSKELTISLISSKFSGKIDIAVNGNQQYVGKSSSKSLFYTTFEFNGVKITLLKVAKGYDLLLGSTAFRSIYSHIPQPAVLHKKTQSWTEELYSFQPVTGFEDDWEDHARMYKAPLPELGTRLNMEVPNIVPHTSAGSPPKFSKQISRSEGDLILTERTLHNDSA